MTAEQGATPSVRVIVHCSEVVVPGGTSMTQWYFLHDKRWLPVRQHPSVQSERLNSGPGTVWEEAVTLLVPQGLHLKQVVTEPAPKRHSLFDYLRKEVRGVPRRTREHEFTAGPGGRLLPLIQGRAKPRL